MDLGYSSSDSDNDDPSAEKRDYTLLNLDEVFEIKERPTVKRRKCDTIDVHAIMEQVKDRIESELTEKEEEEQPEQVEGTAVNDDSQSEIPGGVSVSVPKGVHMEEFNVDDFYEENRRLHETGQLDALKQDKIGKIELHKGSGGVGSLKDVINFNLKNEEKIVFQNKERIARERANKKKL